MIDIEVVVIRDLFSFGCVDYCLKDGVSLVLGDNKDEVGTLSNGCGKSSFMDAFLYVIFGDVAKDGVLADDVVRKGQSEGSGQVKLRNGKVSLDIKRVRKVGKGTELTIWRGAERIEGDRIKDLQEEIFKFLGLPSGTTAKDFLRTNYFSKTAIHSFVSDDVSPEQRMRMVIDALSLDSVTSAMQKVREVVKEFSRQVEIKESVVNVLQLQLVDRKALEQEVSLLALSRDDVQFEIKKYTDEIDRLKEALFGVKKWQQLLVDFTEQESKIKQQLDTKTSVISAIEKDLLTVEDVKKELVDLESQISEEEKLSVQARIKDNEELQGKETGTYIALCASLTLEEGTSKELKKSIVSAIECPACHVRLSVYESAVAIFDSESVVKLIECIEQKVVEYRIQEKEILRRIEECKKEIGKDQEVLKQLSNVSVRIEEMEKKLDFAQNASVRICDLLEECEKLKRDLQDLEIAYKEKVIESSYFDFTLLAFKGKIDALDLGVNQRYSEIQKKNSQLGSVISKLATVQNQLENLVQVEERIEREKNECDSLVVTRSRHKALVDLFLGFRTALLEQFVPVFESKANEFLADMKFSYIVQMSLVKQKSDGEFKPQLNIMINDGSYFRPFSTYSEGEKVRIALACQFALMEISGERKVDLLMMDEVLDSLDQYGFEVFIGMCKKFGKRILVTSRLAKEEVESFADHIITITKSDGVSTLNL